MKQRIVVKVGSAVLTDQNKIAKERMLEMIRFIAELKKTWDVLIVSSGAVAAGYDVLKVDKSIERNKRALAAAGQPILMHAYKKKFDKFNIHTAQILLIEEDFDCVNRMEMFKETVEVHLENGIIPIINENDISSRPEHLFGDNDQLSSRVAHTIGAKMLIILSDIAGYYDKNPKEHTDALLFKEVSEIPKEALLDKHSANNPFATGGIVTKLQAADYMMKNGHQMFLCSGFDLTSVRSYFLDHKHMEGTLFLPKA